MDPATQRPQSPSERLARGVRGVLDPLDAALNRLYGSQLNPLYHSGALAVALFVVVFVTGIYLLFLYRIGSPYASVVRIADQVWLGSWMRSLHRYASDAMVVAVAVHLLRMFAQGRSWGPRTLAWLSGFVLLFLVFVCGWTGYVMVWDIQGLVLAREGARFLDLLPLFSEPIGRAFVGERAIPSAFFFLNLFLHVAIPVGMGVLLWIHVARVARPGLLPPRRLMWGVIALLLVVSIAWPAMIGPEADLFRLPDRAPFDVFFSFWLPLTQPLPAWSVWLVSTLVGLVVLLVPWWGHPVPALRPPPSHVNERLCTGCTQCYLDCPYEAIAMVPHPLRAGERAARVDPSLCVSCGICAGSCAPMGVGPPQRTGRDQLAAARSFVTDRLPGADDIVIIGCTRGAGGATDGATFDGALVYPADCAGSVHTSVVEYLIRYGVGGVVIAACPPRDCWNREGAKWLEQRLYHDREAELKPRVDRRRIRLVYASRGEREAVAAAVRELRATVEALDAPTSEPTIDLELMCDPSSTEVTAP